MSESHPLALPKNTVLAGQYIIQDVLGQGGFGITYKALDRMNGKNVAVKEFFPETMATRVPGKTEVVTFSGEREDNFRYGKQCFMQEAETLAQFIGNDNIVRIYSYFEEYGTAYFVMDFIEGTSLEDHVKSHGGKISFEEAADILVPVMDALGAVHEKGIVHRDVSPDNIYITADGGVKLIDFGAARQSLGDKSQSLDVILKHGFAPKEQYMRRGKQGPYTDIYALGATFYYVLTGKRPPDALERVEEDELIPPSRLGADLSEDAEGAILLALRVQPAERFQSMYAFRNAMLSVRTETSGNTVSTIPEPVVSVAADLTETVDYPYTDVPIGQNGRSKKKYVLAGLIVAVIAAVIAVTALVFKGPASGVGRDGSLYPEIIGNDINNLSNGSGIITEGSLAGSIYTGEGSREPFKCLSVADDTAYAISGKNFGSAVTFTPSDTNEVSVASAIQKLSDFDNISCLYVSEEYFFVFTDDRKMYCVSREDSSVRKSKFDDLEYHQFTFTQSGKFCYIDWGGEHGNWTIYVTPAGKIDEMADVYFTIPDIYSGAGKMRAEVFSAGGDSIFVYLCCSDKDLNKLYRFDLGKDPAKDGWDEYAYDDTNLRQLLTYDGENVFCGYWDDNDIFMIESFDPESKRSDILYKASDATAENFDQLTVYPDKKDRISVLVDDELLNLTVR